MAQGVRARATGSQPDPLTSREQRGVEDCIPVLNGLVNYAFIMKLQLKLWSPMLTYASWLVNTLMCWGRGEETVIHIPQEIPYKRVQSSPLETLPEFSLSVSPFG